MTSNHSHQSDFGDDPRRQPGSSHNDSNNSSSNSESDASETVLHRYFCGVAEHTFQTELGVADPSLIDYISNLLIRFTRTESLLSLRDPSGKRLSHLAAMLAEAEERIGDAKREVHRHIGDFALFWTGLFPEAIEKKTGSDGFHAYCKHGKHAYAVASRIESNTQPPGEVLEQLSDEFEMCAYGLHEVRRELHRRDEGDSGLLFA